MKRTTNKMNRVLLGAFVLSMAGYLVVVTTAFAGLPLSIPPWHQFLLLGFHMIPMFCLQLLLCRMAKPLWRLLVPAVLLALPGVVYLNAVEWAVLGWIMFLYWCAAPALGGVLAWIVWLCTLSVPPGAVKKSTAREHDYKI